MEMVELKLKTIIAKNPHLTISLDGNFNHSLIKEHGNISFSN